jgi:Tfp pilus assembly protein PilF
VLERTDRQQGFERVITLLNRALELDPRFALAHAGLARAYMGLYRLGKRPQDADLAEGHCRRAIELDPLIAQPWLTLGALHAQLGQTDQALGELNQALDRDPRNGLVVVQIAYAYQRQNRLREAEESYRKALADAPDAWTVHAYYGSFLFGRGRWAEAENAFGRARDLAPDNARVLAGLGGVYLKLDRKADAKAALEKSIQLYPTASALSNLGALEYSEGHYGSAAALFEQAAAKNALDFRWWQNAGSAYAQAGRRPESQRAYRRALELGEKERRMDPANGMLAALVADCHAQIGEEAEARQLLKEADTLEPASGTVAERLAEVYEDLGDRNAAIKWLGLAFARGYSHALVDESATFRSLRTDPRYQGLKMVGLKPAGESVK